MRIQDDERRDRYEDRLLTELRALATANAAAGAPERAHRRVRPRLALAGVAGGACAATAAFALMGGEEASTAYAVEPQGDGTVTVEIHELQDAAGLERQLREHGVPAEVDYLPPGLVCRHPRYTPAPRGPYVDEPPPAPSSPLAARADGTFTFTFDKRELGPGETLVITTTAITMPGATPGLSAAESVAIFWGVAQGEVPPCEPVEGQTVRRIDPAGE